MCFRTARRTPLELWTAGRAKGEGSPLTRERLERYQLRQLQATVAWAALRSPYYRKKLAGVPEGGPLSLAELRSLPFTPAEDLRERGGEMLCVSQDQIQRVVTLSSSGTTGTPKRLYFTAEEQEATVEFFRYGMSTFVDRGDRVLILLPGHVSGSVGALLATALERMGVTPIPHGFVRDLPEAMKVVQRYQPTNLVGAPVQVLTLLHYAQEIAGIPFHPKTALLTTDHVPSAIVRRLETGWGCRIFEHYGMTEMGLGGAVDCEARAGYHLREADLYFEIVDPVSGEPVPDGSAGEVVFTTLTRRGMPLIRYRTGDLSRFLLGTCPCGTFLRRLERVKGRIGGRSIPCGQSGEVTLPVLDEALFQVEELVDFAAATDDASRPARLAITAWSVSRDQHTLASAVNQALDRVPAIQSARRAGTLAVTIVTGCIVERPWAGPQKRAISKL